MARINSLDLNAILINYTSFMGYFECNLLNDTRNIFYDDRMNTQSSASPELL